MNELKPVAWHTKDDESDKSATTYNAEVAERWRAKGLPVTPHFLAIPDTHRVVSVELLKSYQAAIEAGQFMGFDEEYEQMQAIIDNKEQKE